MGLLFAFSCIGSYIVVEILHDGSGDGIVPSQLVFLQNIPKMFNKNASNILGIKTGTCPGSVSTPIYLPFYWVKKIGGGQGCLTTAGLQL